MQRDAACATKHSADSSGLPGMAVTRCGRREASLGRRWYRRRAMQNRLPSRVRRTEYGHALLNLRPRRAVKEHRPGREVGYRLGIRGCPKSHQPASKEHPMFRETWPSRTGNKRTGRPEPLRRQPCPCLRLCCGSQHASSATVPKVFVASLQPGRRTKQSPP